MKSLLIFAPYECKIVDKLRSRHISHSRLTSIKDESYTRVALPPLSWEMDPSSIPWGKELSKRFIPILWYMPIFDRKDAIKAMGLSVDGQMLDFDYAKMFGSDIPWRYVVTDYFASNWWRTGLDQALLLA